MVDSHSLVSVLTLLTKDSAAKKIKCTWKVLKKLVSGPRVCVVCVFVHVMMNKWLCLYTRKIMHTNISSTPHLPPNAGLMVKSWSSTLSRCSVFILRDLVTSGGFFAKDLEEDDSHYQKVVHWKTGLWFWKIKSTAQILDDTDAVTTENKTFNLMIYIKPLFLHQKYFSFLDKSAFQMSKRLQTNMSSWSITQKPIILWERRC